MASRGNLKGGKKLYIRYIVGRVGYWASVVGRGRGSVSGGRESGRWLWECLSAAEVLAFDSLAKPVGLEDLLKWVEFIKRGVNARRYGLVV